MAASPTKEYAKGRWRRHGRLKMARKGLRRAMVRIVQKFGGTSVGDIDRIKNAALRVKREVDAGNEVVVVVSAMAGTTNQLVGWVREINPLHDTTEYDTVVASGEQV